MTHSYSQVLDLGPPDKVAAPSRAAQQMTLDPWRTPSDLSDFLALRSGAGNIHMLRSRRPLRPLATLGSLKAKVTVSLCTPTTL